MLVRGKVFKQGARPLLGGSYRLDFMEFLDVDVVLIEMIRLKLRSAVDLGYQTDTADQG